MSDEKPKPFAPLGSNMSVSQQRLSPISEDKKQTHALEHIAKVLDRIDAKLDALLAERKKPDA